MYMIFMILLLITALYGSLICPNLSRRDRMLPYHHMNWAHRGYHSIEHGIPENSMIAFRLAIQRGYGIEMDVHLTKDHQLVIFHDDDLKRICQIDDIVENMTYAQLQNCRLSGTRERIPLFSDFLKLVDGRVPLLIEIKLPHRDTTICGCLQQALSDYEGPYLIQSFNPLVLRWFYKNVPGVLRGQLSSNLTKSNKDTPYLFRFAAKYLLTNLLCKPDFISYKLKDSRNLSLWIIHHIYNVPVAVWTLRTKKEQAQGARYYDMNIFEDHGTDYQ